MILQSFVCKISITFTSLVNTTISILANNNFLRYPLSGSMQKKKGIDNE